MQMYVLKTFPYAHDHHVVVSLQPDTVVEIDDDVAGGLEDEGFIREPTAEEIEAAQEGCVVIAAPIEIPADWAKLSAAAAVKLAKALGYTGAKSKADAHAAIEHVLAQRADAGA